MSEEKATYGFKWCCKGCGELLGHWNWRKEGQHRVEVLTSIHGEEHIGMGRVQCPKCLGWRIWEPGSGAIEAFLKHITERGIA